MKCQNCGNVVPLDAVFCAYCGAKLEKPWEFLPVGLERARLEVEAIDKATRIDPKIKDLVVGLRRWGVATRMSCQGHYFSGQQFPWVEVSTRSEALTRIVELSWRGSAKLHFVIKRSGSFWRLIPQKGGCLRLWGLQREAIIFGKFLQEVPDDFFEKEVGNDQNEVGE